MLHKYGLECVVTLGQHSFVHVQLSMTIGMTNVNYFVLIHSQQWTSHFGCTVSKILVEFCSKTEKTQFL